MKNQREIYEALLAGETLINSRGCKVKLYADGNVRYEDDEGSDGRFLVSLDWQIYKEPKWYENIPDGGVLCWHGKGLTVVYLTTTNDMDAYTPLTKQEIQVFMDNAPEE